MADERAHLRNAGPAAVEGTSPSLRARLVYRISGAPAGSNRRGAVSGLDGNDGGSDWHAGGLAIAVDLSLAARRAVLFGPSGAGKTTLLRLLAGLLLPDEGSISFGPNQLTNTASGVFVPPGQRGIGYLTQAPALFPHLSVESNIAFGLHGLARETRMARVSAMLALFSLEPLATRMPLRLSGGERQRVALARALAPKPTLLLLDEPFAGLDASLREQTIAALDHYLATRETTVLSVSHDVAEVYASGAEVLLLEAGRITAQGPSREVLAAHRERLLRQLGAATDRASG